MKGYVYFVTRYGFNKTPELHRVKIGYTTSYAVEAQLHNWYSRSMAPLCILKVIPVGNARSAESLLHYALNLYRLEPKHEIFVIDSIVASDSVDKSVQMLLSVQEMSGLELPLIRPFDYDFWKLLREVIKAAKQMSNRIQKKAEAEAREKERERQRLQRHERLQLAIFRAETAAEQKRLQEEANQLEELSAAEHNCFLKEANRLEKLEIANCQVKEFFSANTRKNGDLKSHVDRATMFKIYEDQHGELQRYYKTRVDKKRFLKLMIEFFGEHCHFEKKMGKRDVFFGWTLISD